jgi:two-component system, cell cycle sensor histidine kinase and response regulator CckA
MSIGRALAHQKAIMINGFAEAEEVRQTQAMGAGEFLKKPLTLERLGRAFKRELAKTVA